MPTTRQWIQSRTTSRMTITMAAPASARVVADRYDEIYRAFRWDVPREFNIADACCRRWSVDRHRFALYYEDDAGNTSKHTYWDLQQDANRLSNALAALGVRRGERIAIMLPQRPETAVAHLA